MTNLNDQQRQALFDHQGSPVPIVDEQTQKLYYLISADQFEKVRALLVEEDFDPREMYPLISKTAAEAGWKDPEMDAYDHYDEHRAKQG